jgi:hypothetical protein
MFPGGEINSTIQVPRCRGRNLPLGAVIHRGIEEIGGTFLELRSGANGVFLAAGYPLFRDQKPIDACPAFLGPAALPGPRPRLSIGLPRLKVGKCLMSGP